jgi:hypothetical protein
MKEVSENVASVEQSASRKIVELYRFWMEGTYYTISEYSAFWYYTNADYNVTYDTKVYVPALISRGTAQYDSKAEVSKMTVRISRTSDIALRYIAMNPIESLWVEILRAYPDTDPLEVTVVFIGQIKNVKFKGIAAEVDCVGFEFLLKQQIPTNRYGPTCNWTLFDTRCQKSMSGFTDTRDAVRYVSGFGGGWNIPLTWSEDKKSITTYFNQCGLYHDQVDLIGSKGEKFFDLGYVEYVEGGLGSDGTGSCAHRRMIASSVLNTYDNERGILGSTVRLRYPMSELPDWVLPTQYYYPPDVVGVSIRFYAGCDGSIYTCRDKFNNVVNFGGHPYVPKDNPVTWE